MASKVELPGSGLEFDRPLDEDEFFVLQMDGRVRITRSTDEARAWSGGEDRLHRMSVRFPETDRPEGVAPPAQMKKFPRVATAFVAVGTRKDGSEFVPQMPGALDAHKECIENRFLPPLQQTFPEVAWRAEPLFTERPLHMGKVS